jgi:hypothetical protein
MRNWIRLVESLTEAPIEDMGVLGDLENPGSMQADDLKAIQSPKWQLKLRDRFANNPYPINIYFLNAPDGKQKYVSHRGRHADHVDALYVTSPKPGWGNKKDASRLDVAATFIKSHAGIYSAEEFQKYFGFVPPNPENSISVLLAQNEGSGRVPFTQWMVAHRMMHAIFTGARQRNKSWSDAPGHGLWGAAGVVTYAYQDFLNQATDALLAANGGGNVSHNDIGKAFGTTKAQREGKMINSGEFYIDMGAQYLLTGRVKLKNTSSETLDLFAQHWTEIFTRDFGRLLSQCVGKIFVF